MSPQQTLIRPCEHELRQISRSQLTALQVNGEHLSLAHVLRLAKWREQLEFLLAAADLALIRQQAGQLRIEVREDELQQAADDFRAARGLYEVVALEEWLGTNHFTFADWEYLLEDEVITGKLRDALTNQRVEQYFAENKVSFDAATISRLVVRYEEVAKELRVQICEEGADFHKLARAYSTDVATRPAGGYVGVVKRRDVAVEAVAAVFSARAGRIVGPVKIDQGWHLIRVHELHRATLDESVREEIKALLFREWLSRQRSKAQINIPLLEEIGESEEVDEGRDRKHRTAKILILPGGEL